MHLLLIHEIFVTPDEGGGTRHYELAKYFVQMGHKVTVIASDVDYLSGNKKMKKREIREGIEIIYAPTLSSVHKSFLGRGLAFLSFSFSSFFEALKVRGFDLVIGTSPPLFQAITSLVIAKLKRKKFVYEVRDLWIDFASELGVVRNKSILNLLKKLENLLYKKADLIIVNSPGFLPFILSSISKNKVILIPNGVDTEYFSDAIEKNKELESKLGLSGKFVIMYAGNLGVANDIDTILNTAMLLKDVRDIVFVLVGGGIRKDEIKKQIKTEGIENVMVFDSVSKKELPKVISLADVCLATIKNTPLLQIVYPNKVFDYMASGKPTILTIGGVIRNVIEESNGGIYVPPGSPEKLKDAILNYYSNRELVVSHGRNAKSYVKKHFERAAIAKQFETALLQLLDK
jgi:glycosyltransferase involved in cell wall biosynthesis